METLKEEIAEATPQTYFLPEHIHACRCGSHVIFLDTTQEHYTAVTWPAGDLPFLCTGESAWRGRFVVDVHSQPYVDELLDRGLLTRTRPSENGFVAVAAEPATRLVAEDELEPRSIRLVHIAQFVAARWCARRLLKRPLFESIQRFRRRKARVSGEVFDLPTLRRLVNAYQCLRPLGAAHERADLFDSYALLEFLSARDQYVSFVLGITTVPLRKHAWLQADHYVLNEEPAFVRGFKPILVV